jgi:MFS family permease
MIASTGKVSDSMLSLSPELCDKQGMNGSLRGQPTVPQSQEDSIINNESADAETIFNESPKTFGTSADKIPSEERSKSKIALIMFAIAMAVFLAARDTTIITTALETISSDFHSSAGFTWIGSYYLLATAASTPIWGKISDIFGRKQILLIANVVFFVGSLIAGLSINIGMLITARAIQGIGGGGLLVLANICVADLFSPRRRGAYYSIIGSVWALANSLGPVIGGVFTTTLTWRWCFYINLPLDGLAFLVILVFLDLKTPRTPVLKGLAAIDWLGAFLIVTGTLVFLFGLELGGTSFPWISAKIICSLVFGVVAAALFVLVEKYLAKYLIMPIRIFKHGSSLASLGVCFFHAFTFIAGNYYLPLYFQAVLGATPLHSGVYTLAISISTSLSSITTGLYIRKLECSYHQFCSVHHLPRPFRFSALGSA